MTQHFTNELANKQSVFLQQQQAELASKRNKAVPFCCWLHREEANRGLRGARLSRTQ